MRCERVMERFLDALTGETGGDPGDEARAHIDACQVCGPLAARYRELWGDLDRLEPPATASPSSEEAIARRLSDAFWARARAELASSAGASGATRRRWPSRIPLAAAILAALLVGGIGGYLLAPRFDRAVSQPVALNGDQSFLLLLHESPELRARFALLPMDSVVAEYRAWAGQLAADGRLSGAAKLEDQVRFVARTEGGLVVERREPDELGDMVTGYFLIKAADYEEALKITAGAPHLSYGGTVEVRSIDQGS